MNQVKKEYMEVDVNALSTVLAEEAWSEATKMNPKEDLYEKVQVPVSSIYPWESITEEQMQVRSKWAYLFFSIKEEYRKLIEQFKK